MAGADFDVSQKAQKAQNDRGKLWRRMIGASYGLGKLSLKTQKTQSLLSSFNYSKLSTINNL